MLEGLADHGGLQEAEPAGRCRRVLLDGGQQRRCPARDAWPRSAGRPSAGRWPTAAARIAQTRPVAAARTASDGEPRPARQPLEPGRDEAR